MKRNRCLSPGFIDVYEPRRLNCLYQVTCNGFTVLIGASVNKDDFVIFRTPP